MRSASPGGTTSRRSRSSELGVLLIGVGSDLAIARRAGQAGMPEQHLVDDHVGPVLQEIGLRMCAATYALSPTCASQLPHRLNGRRRVAR